MGRSISFSSNYGLSGYKFMFAVQPSYSPLRFNPKSPFGYDDEYFYFRFTKEDLENINLEVQKIESYLGKAKGLIDDFFKTHYAYDNEELLKFLNENGIGVDLDGVQSFLENYADLRLAKRLIKAIEEDGEVEFEAER